MRRKSWEVNGLVGPAPPSSPGRGERGEGKGEAVAESLDQKP